VKLVAVFRLATLPLGIQLIIIITSVVIVVNFVLLLLLFYGRFISPSTFGHTSCALDVNHKQLLSHYEPIVLEGSTIDYWHRLSICPSVTLCIVAKRCIL